MNVLDQDRTEGRIRLRVDTMDDLWHLYQLVQVGDRVTKSTRRSPSTADDKIRPEKRSKERMTLTLEVDGVEFHEFADRLRIGGEIVDGPQDLGQHHTFNVESGEELTIHKTWRPHQLERLREAVEATETPELLVVAVEHGEACIAEVRRYGAREVTTLTAGGLGKGGDEPADPAGFWDRVIDAVERLGGDDHPVLVVGPGFAKEDLIDHARQERPGVVDDWHVDSTSQGGWPGIQEALNRGHVEKVSEEARVAQEAAAVEAFLTALGRDEPVTYGLDEVTQALEMGAVERLLVTDELVRSREVDDLLDEAEATSADYMTVSTHHDAGEKLASLGGVAATLRYRIS